MTPRRFVYLFLGALTLLRLALIATTELSPDEAYYYLWSQHLDICYFSKGPGVAAAIWLGSHLFGPSEFGIRVLSPLLAAGTGLLMFSFARRLYSDSVGAWAVLALNAIPIFTVGALVMTIDPLSIFFWMAATYAFWLALERGSARNLWWAATGLLIGLGLLCKYTNAVQYLSIVLLLLWTPKHRRELGRLGFWLMTAMIALCFAPPVVWNSQHDYISLHHLTVRGGLEQAFRVRPTEFLKFLGAHYGVYSPLIFGAMLYAGWMGLKRAQSDFKSRFLVAFTIPLFAMYFGLAINKAGEPNWTAPACLTLGLLAIAHWHEACAESLAARRFCVTAVAGGFALSVFIVDTDLLRLAGLPLSYSRDLSALRENVPAHPPAALRFLQLFVDPSGRIRGWKTTAEAVDEFRQKFEAASGHVFMIADRYQLAAELGYYLKNKPVEGPGHPPVYTPESEELESEFSLWPSYDEVNDLPQVAREYLAAPVEDGKDPRPHAEVAKALEGLQRADSAKSGEAKRALARALHVAAQQLPLDESLVEDEGPNLFAGRTALYICDRYEERPPASIQRGFKRVEFQACIDIHRYGEPVRQIRIFACYHYHGLLPHLQVRHPTLSAAV